MIKTFFTNAAAMEVMLLKPQMEKEKRLMTFIGNA